MKTDDIKVLTEDQLADELAKLKKEQFNLRFQKATGQLENTARVRRFAAPSRSSRRPSARRPSRPQQPRPEEDRMPKARPARRRRLRQERQDGCGEGGAPLHPSAAEEDGPPHQELPRP